MQGEENGFVREAKKGKRKGKSEKKISVERGRGRKTIAWRRPS